MERDRNDPTNPGRKSLAEQLSAQFSAQRDSNVGAVAVFQCMDKRLHGPSFLKVVQAPRTGYQTVTTEPVNRTAIDGIDFPDGPKAGTADGADGLRGGLHYRMTGETDGGEAEHPESRGKR